jgi:hypothetical protein
MKMIFFFIFALTALLPLISCEDMLSNRKMAQSPEITRSDVGTEGIYALRSHIHREKGTKTLSYADEIQKTLRGDLPASIYRVIPLMEKDDEGSKENVVTVNELGRPDFNCGSGDSFIGIDPRIVDCSEKNGAKALWEGFRYGAAGESTWTLVMRNNSKEIWLDGRTGMVWSHLIVTAEDKKIFNWCKASGNDQNNTTIAVLDCNELGIGESLCAGQVFEEIGEKVNWRLPTRNDYLQADINGFRFVFVKEESQGLWTATIRALSDGRKEAWVYESKEGTLSGGVLSSLRHVRCIGAPTR